MIWIILASLLISCVAALIVVLEEYLTVKFTNKEFDTIDTISILLVCGLPILNVLMVILTIVSIIKEINSIFSLDRKINRIITNFIKGKK